MAEVRKPYFVFLLKKQGKKNNKVELFKQSDFENKPFRTQRYRMRINGKWVSLNKCKYDFFTKWEIRDLIWRSIKI